MKKFLVCAALALAFVGGLFAFGVGETAVSVKKCNYSSVASEDVETAKSVCEEGASAPAGGEAYLGSIEDSKNLVYNVLLFEFRDCPNYFTQERIDYMNNLFNDTNPENYVYSVHEYLKDMSYGKVSVFANIYLHKDSQDKAHYQRGSVGFSEEYSTYQQGMLSSTVCYENYETINPGALIVFSSKMGANSSSRMWGHAYCDHYFVSITDEEAIAPVIVHEIMHNFGIADMYNPQEHVQGKAPVGYSDIMAATHIGPINTYMYNKAVLNWVQVSDYDDDVQTEIETITKNGTYTLYPTADQGKNIKAYKFGVKQGDKRVYFMVEYRKPQKNKIDGGILSREGLVVYRVNEKYKKEGNYNKKYTTYETYAFRPVNNYYYSSNAEHFTYKNETIGNLADKNYYLYYEDNQICKCILSNVTYNSNGTVSFDFQDLQDEDVVAGMIKDGTTYLNKIDVFVNDVYKTTTFHRGYFVLSGVKDDDVITFRSQNGKYNFKPLIAKVNSYSLTVYASEVNAKIEVRINGNFDNIKYNLYKFENENWEFVGTVISNQVKQIYLQKGKTYKISGAGIDDYEFTVTKDDVVVIEQKESLPEAKTDKQSDKEGKDLLGSISDAIGNALEAAGNAIVDGFNSIVDFFSSWF